MRNVIHRVSIPTGGHFRDKGWKNFTCECGRGFIYLKHPEPSQVNRYKHIGVTILEIPVHVVSLHDPEKRVVKRVFDGTTTLGVKRVFDGVVYRVIECSCWEKLAFTLTGSGRNPRRRIYDFLMWESKRLKNADRFESAELAMAD